MLSINTIARVIVNVVRPAAQPTSWDTGLLLVKDLRRARAVSWSPAIRRWKRRWRRWMQSCS